MLKFIHFLKNNLLLKISSWNAISVLVTSSAALVSSKIVALFLGAEGMALLGNFRNFLKTIQTAGSLGSYNGLVAYTSKLKDNEEACSRFISTAFFVALLTSAFVSLVLYIGADFWSEFITHTVNYGFIFKALALAAPLYTLNLIALGIINGFSAYRAYTSITLMTSLLGLIITILFIYHYSLTGAFFAIIITPIINLFLTSRSLYRHKSVLNLISIQKVHLEDLKKLGSYGVMALFTALVLPLVSIAIRNYVLETQNIQMAGYWEGMQRISNQYMIFFSTLLTLYFLPKFAALKTKLAFRKEIFNFYKTLMPIFVIGLFIIFLLRDWIVRLLFSTDFLPMQELFGWYLVGDIFKIGSVVLAYQFIAKRMIFHYLITELLSIVILYIASIICIDIFGFVGAAMGHLINYVFYFLMMIFIFRKTLFITATDNL